MEELPYACYSATQVASPHLPRATSLEGRSSPYAASSATYQSIEGLAEGFRETPDNTSSKTNRCGTCGSRASGSSARRPKTSRCHQHPHHHHHHGARQTNPHYHQYCHIKLNKASADNIDDTQGKENCASTRTSMSSTQLNNPSRCCNAPETDEFRLACGYTPNFYGWMSPPGSPRNVFQQGTYFDCDAMGLECVSVYGGSTKSDTAGDYGPWDRDGSIYESSTKSLDAENSCDSEAANEILIESKSETSCDIIEEDNDEAQCQEECQKTPQKLVNCSEKEDGYVRKDGLAITDSSKDEIAPSADRQTKL